MKKLKYFTFSEEWLKQEYGSIFNKVIMVEPVMQKVRLGSGSKLPSIRLGGMQENSGPGQKRRNRWNPKQWMDRGDQESNEELF